MTRSIRPIRPDNCRWIVCNGDGANVAGLLFLGLREAEDFIRALGEPYANQRYFIAQVVMVSEATSRLS